MKPSPAFRFPRTTTITSIVAGAAYGLLFHFVFDEYKELGGLLVVAFMVVMPLVLGFLVILQQPRDVKQGWLRAIFLPWLAVLLMTAVSLIFALEGVICLVIWLPLSLFCSSFGGVLGGVVHSARQKPPTSLMIVAGLLPLLIAPVERQFTPSDDLRIVETTIDIRSDEATIWREIREVPMIREEELATTFTHRLGFPRPLEARLKGEGVGAVRYATFERDVLFIETITVWEPGHRLAFSIKADSSIPPTTFDEHVVVGGRYFEVLDGTYTIERIAPDRCRLHLSSRQRLSTPINLYAGLWTEYFMQDIQESILEVIRHRCEK